MTRLTELDHCVLGVIWRSGPLSAYRVRSVFAKSNTAAWSSSAGSIYPSIRRLVSAGLVSTAAASDRRGTQSLKVTTSGVERLRGWFADLAPAIGTATPDPIRTRAQFLSSLPVEGRKRFIENARRITEDALLDLLKVAEKEPASEADRLDLLGTKGAILELEARLEWLKLVLDGIEEGSMPGTSQREALIRRRLAAGQQT